MTTLQKVPQWMLMKLTSSQQVQKTVANQKASLKLWMTILVRLIQISCKIQLIPMIRIIAPITTRMTQINLMNKTKIISYQIQRKLLAKTKQSRVKTRANRMTKLMKPIIISNKIQQRQRIQMLKLTALQILMIKMCRMATKRMMICPIRIKISTIPPIQQKT